MRRRRRDTGVGKVHGGQAIVTADGARLRGRRDVVAAGRTPATADIGLESVGLDVGASHGYLRADEPMAVIGGDGWLYAVGDVCGRKLLTHMGKYQARIAGDVIAARAEGRWIEGARYGDRRPRCACRR